MQTVPVTTNPKRNPSRSGLGRLALLVLAALSASPLAALPPRQTDTIIPLETDVRAVPTPIVADSLDRMVREKRYVDLRAALSVRPALTREESEYFQGILDNRTNSLDSSARLLEHVIPALRLSQQTERLHAALRALADNYGKRFEYGRAVDTMRSLEREGGSALSAAERRDIRSDAALYDLLRGQSPQKIEFAPLGREDNVQGQRNSLGLLEIPVSVGDTAPSLGQAESWVVDTGANLSTVTRTTAERLHLTLLSGKATVRGIGGDDIPMQVAVIPVVRLGRAIVRNVAVLVLDDRALNVGQPAYQIQGIIGFPVLAALGRLTFGPNDRIGFGKTTTTADKGSSNLYMDGLTPLVVVGTESGPRLFKFDTGANVSVLSSRYFREHEATLADAPAFTYRFAGADGIKSVPARKAPRITLRLDGLSMSMTGLPVLTGPLGNAESDSFYGHLGQDMIKPFSSYTLDFRTMRFTLQLKKG